MLHVLVLMDAHRLILLVLHPLRRCGKLHLLHLVTPACASIDKSMTEFVLAAGCYGSRLHLWSIVGQCGKLVYVKSEREGHGCHAFIVFLLTRGASIINLLHLDVSGGGDIRTSLAVTYRCERRIGLSPAISVVKDDVGWSLQYLLEDSFGEDIGRHGIYITLLELSVIWVGALKR